LSLLLQIITPLSVVLTTHNYPHYNTHMKAIQITINSELLQLIDKECAGKNRSAFFRQAAQAWLKQLRILKMEKKHNEGYTRYPVKIGEFDLWSDEQVWPE
jgi:hypothetical protein